MPDYDYGEQVKVTFLTSSILLEKLKVIADRNNTLPGEEINEALNRKVEEFEKENGKIEIKE